MVFRWLLPLGFLGLLSLIGLIIIYILKPKYTERRVSSTIPWKLALKKRKKFPFDRFSNLLVFLCQVAILSAGAMILAQPTLLDEDLIDQGVEKIIILDAGMNMRAKYAEYDGQYNLTRFERAINEIKAEIDKVLYEDDGTISVIMAEKEPRFLLEDMGREDYTTIVTALDEAECSYSVPDLQGAVLAAQEKMSVNPQAHVEIFSGTDFGYMGEAVTVHNLSSASQEWNIAILSATPSYVDNQYYFEVEVAAYGNVSKATTLYIDVLGVNDGVEIKDFKGLHMPVTFEVDANHYETGVKQTLKIEATDVSIGGDPAWWVPSFREVKMEFRDLDDSIEEDNYIYVYGGERDEIKVQYYSARRNMFFFLTFYSIQESMRDVREVTFDPVYDIDEEPRKKGFDFYIYEHDVPLETFDGGLPDDGVTIFCDPTPEILEYVNIGVTTQGRIPVDKETTLTRGTPSPITANIDAERITISEYLKVIPNAGSGFESLLFCGDDPVLFSKKQGASQIVIMPFSVNQSNVYIGPLPMLFYNIIDYFMPLTLTEYAFEVDDTVTLNCKGVRIDVNDPLGDKVDELREFPADYPLEKVGTYRFTTLFALNKPNEVKRVYVRPPMSESCLFQIADLGLTLDNDEVYLEHMKDVFVWFAAAIVLLLFAEWWLQYKDII